MEIIVKGEPKEIAAFVLELQGQPDALMDRITQSLESISDETNEKRPNTVNEQAFLMATEQIKISISEEDAKYLHECAEKQLIATFANHNPVEQPQQSCRVEPEELTERELYCISRHTKYLVYTFYQARQGIEAPCYSCPYNQECGLDFMATLVKLGEITGEKIGLCTNSTPPVWSVKEREPLKIDNVVLQMLANMQQVIYADLIDMAVLLAGGKEKTLLRPTLEMLDAMSAYAISLECLDKIDDAAFLKNESVKDEKEALLNVVQNSIQLQNSIYAILIQQ